MNISLDWDHTFTADPILWMSFVAQARRNGHKVFIVTMRHPDEAVKLPGDCEVDAVYYTGRLAKKPFMMEQGVFIHIWIDDRPDFIYHDSI